MMHHTGTETATEWSGFLNGAVQAGRRAADEIVAALKESTTVAEVAAGERGPFRLM